MHFEGGKLFTPCKQEEEKKILEGRKGEEE
jgi:hypothetical protein